MESSEQKQTINWDAVQAIGVILTVLATWKVGDTQVKAQFAVVSEQLKFAQNERDAENRRRRRPILAFDRMTFRLPVAKSTTAHERFDWPRDKQGRVLQDKGYPSIKNYGEGPAIHIQVSYENKTPSPASAVPVPFHCLPGESVQCFHIPKVINDPTAPADNGDGVVRIICEDTAGERHVVEQEYYAQVVDSELVFIFKEIRRTWPMPPRDNPTGLRESY